MWVQIFDSKTSIKLTLRNGYGKWRQLLNQLSYKRTHLVAANTMCTFRPLLYWLASQKAGDIESSLIGRSQLQYVAGVRSVATILALIRVLCRILGSSERSERRQRGQDGSWHVHPFVSWIVIQKFIYFAVFCSLLLASDVSESDSESESDSNSHSKLSILQPFILSRSATFGTFTVSVCSC